MELTDDNSRLIHQALPSDPEADAEPIAQDPGVFGDAWRTLEEHGGLEWFAVEPPPRRWLIERRGELGEDSSGIPLGKVAMITAAGGVGKTMALVQLALAVASGREWLDTFITPNPGHVLLALGEEDAEEVRRRFYAAGRLLKLTDEQQRLAAQRIEVLPLAAKRLALTSEDGAATEVLEELLERLRSSPHEWRLIALDPLSRFAGLDAEVDNHAATTFVELLETLAQVPGGPAVVIAHHTTKASRAADGESSVTNAARGASALTDGVRWVAHLEPDKRDPRRSVRFMITKSNYSPHTTALTLVREEGGALRAELAEPKQQKQPLENGTARRASTRSDDSSSASVITDEDF